MELKLERFLFTNESTIGKLSIDANPFCYTLEDIVRPDGIKIQNETAIPAGRYKVEITWSERFQKELPELRHVHGFTYIRIHSGNTPNDTEGCILVGRTYSHNFVGDSRITLAKLMTKLKGATSIWITVSNAVNMEASRKAAIA